MARTCGESDSDSGGICLTEGEDLGLSMAVGGMAGGSWWTSDADNIGGRKEGERTCRWEADERRTGKSLNIFWCKFSRLGSARASHPNPSQSRSLPNFGLDPPSCLSRSGLVLATSKKERLLF
jgi:hypothetical protein